MFLVYILLLFVGFFVLWPIANAIAIFAESIEAKLKNKRRNNDVY